MICFPLSISESELQSRSNSKDFISTTSDCFVQHSSMLCQGFYENHITYHCLSSSFHFPSSFVTLTSFPKAHYLCLVIWSAYWGYHFLPSTMMYSQIQNPTYSSALIFVQFLQHNDKRLPMMRCLETPFFLDVFVQVAMIFQNQIPLGVSNTQLCTQDVEDIGELRHCLVPFLSHCGPSRVLVFIVFDGVILPLKSIHKG